VDARHWHRTKEPVDAIGGNPLRPLSYCEARLWEQALEQRPDRRWSTPLPTGVMWSSAHGGCARECMHRSIASPVPHNKPLQMSRIHAPCSGIMMVGSVLGMPLFGLIMRVATTTGKERNVHIDALQELIDPRTSGHNHGMCVILLPIAGFLLP
jgi:hypothetical protein